MVIALKGAVDGVIWQSFVLLGFMVIVDEANVHLVLAEIDLTSLFNFFFEQWPFEDLNCGDFHRHQVN